MDLKILHYDKSAQQLCWKNEYAKVSFNSKRCSTFNRNHPCGYCLQRKNLKSGGQMAAWLGLVCQQHSSEGNKILFNISKRGDCYLRRLLIHGTRTVVKKATHKLDTMSGWVRGLTECRG